MKLSTHTHASDPTNACFRTRRKQSVRWRFCSLWRTYRTCPVPGLLILLLNLGSRSSRSRELNRRPIYEYRCDERLQVEVEGSTWLTYTGWLGGLEQLKIETRWTRSVNRREVFECDGWVCGLETLGVSSIFKTICSATVLTRMLPTLDLTCEGTPRPRGRRFLFFTSWKRNVDCSMSENEMICMF